MRLLWAPRLLPSPPRPHTRGLLPAPRRRGTTNFAQGLLNQSTANCVGTDWNTAYTFFSALPGRWHLPLCHASACLHASSHALGGSWRPLQFLP